MLKQQRFDELSKLENGWLDGEGIAPNDIAINNAKQISLLLEQLTTIKQFIYPVPSGGVQLEFNSNTIEIVCHNNGTLEVSTLD